MAPFQSRKSLTGGTIPLKIGERRKGGGLAEGKKHAVQAALWEGLTTGSKVTGKTGSFPSHARQVGFEMGTALQGQAFMPSCLKQGSVLRRCREVTVLINKKESSER